MSGRPPTGPIAIVGMAGRFPGAPDLAAFWRNIRDGVESLDDVTEADLDAAGVHPVVRANPRYVRKCTVLEHADHFDAAFFGYSPREAQILDPQQRVFLECAWEAVEDAGYAGRVAGQRVGVFAGAGMNSYLTGQILRDPALAATVGAYQLMIGNDKDFLCTRVAYELDLRGPAVTIQTACSTSLVAIQTASRSLQRDECDMALAGGVSISFPERTGYLHEAGMIFSPDGHCRPFDHRAAGTRGGNGAGIVVLKRLADALADRDTIHAVILGSAVNNDGSGKAGFTAPSIEGQAEVVGMALADAGIEPRSIGYLEAHGTATPLGDPIEIAAITRAYRASTGDTGFCRLGSIKANLGHLDAAAGVAGLIKAVLALRHRELPPLLHFESPNPQLDLARSPFTASPSRSAWPGNGHPRRAAVSSFGIGGTNAHVVLEEGPVVAPAKSSRGAHLLPLSAKTPTALDHATRRLAEYLGRPGAAQIEDVCYTLQSGRQAFRERRAVVVSDATQAVVTLGSSQMNLVTTGTHDGAARPVAFLFSGQGSQHAGMGAELYRLEPAYRAAFDRCVLLLEPRLGLDIREVVFGGPGREAELHETRVTQPLLFATEYALASLWSEWGVRPAAMLGHSVGEYVAAHLASVLTLEDALMLVAERGRLMQALPRGAMLSVHLSADDMAPWLEDGAELAALNAPAMCAVSGPPGTIAALATRLSGAGIEHRSLLTSHAFHSAMMDPLFEPFMELVARVPLAAPSIPYLSNVTGTWITANQATSPEYYATHLRQAVRFDAGLRALGETPVALLEVGPGNALATLARLSLGRAAARRIVASLPHPREPRSEIATMLEAAGRLWVSGVNIDWEGLHAHSVPRRVPLPTYPFERRQFRVEPARTSGATREDFPARSAQVDDWFFAPTWRRDAGRGPVVELTDTWLIVAPPGELGADLAERVRAAGAVPLLVEAAGRAGRIDSGRYGLRLGSREDFAMLGESLAAAGQTIAGVFHLLTAQEPSGAARGDDAIGISAYHSLVALASGLHAVSLGRPVPMMIVATLGSQSVLAEPVRMPGSALMSGPVLALPGEIPGLQIRGVDLSSRRDGGTDAAHVGALLAEAVLRDGERSVAWRAGRRWVRRAEQLRLPAPGLAAAPLRANGVYLIVGGLGGIGLALARWLAQTCGARLALTSLMSLPPRKEWDAWLATHQGDDRAAAAIEAVRGIEAAGGEVLLATADAADERAMRAVIDSARARWGALHGVIHAAGLPGGLLALTSSAGDSEAVFSAKVEGLPVLVSLLSDAQLDFVALCSSYNSLVGGAGISAYTSSNAYLDAFAESDRRPAGWRTVTAIDWWAWSETGMATRLVVPAALRAARDAFVRTGIPSADGAAAFGRALASELPRVIVTPFDFTHPYFLHPAVDAAPAPGVLSRGRPAAPAPANQPRPQLSSGFTAPGNPMERQIAEIWSDLLGVDEIGIDDDFFELGGHSLLATRVLARIESAFGARLSIRAVFEAPTIRALRQSIEATRDLLAPPMAEAGGDREEIEF